jgi:hypothetical protein
MTDESVFVITTRKIALEKAPGSAMSVNADRLGNVIFQRDEVPPDRLEDGLRRCTALAGRLVEKLQKVSADFHVETVTLKLTLDAEVGLAFVGEASIEAGIEVVIARVDAKG